MKITYPRQVSQQEIAQA